MDQVAHQAVVIQFILEMAANSQQDPRGCFRQFFSKAKVGDTNARVHTRHCCATTDVADCNSFGILFSCFLVRTDKMSTWKSSTQSSRPSNAGCENTQSAVTVNRSPKKLGPLHYRQ